MSHRLTVIVSARPSWAKLQPVCEALTAIGQPFELIACAYAVTHAHGGVLDVMREDGYDPTVMHAAIDAATLETSALTTGLLLTRLTGYFATTHPSGVVICADRHETISAAIAAAYQNIPVLHLQGGETSRNIDRKVRAANTALSDWHAVSNADAYGRVVQAGAHIDRVFICGCPSIDVARLAKDDPPLTREELDRHGTGASIDPQQPFTILMHHPSTEHPERAGDEWIDAYVTAHEACPDRPMVIFWPGADAGADESAKVMRRAQPWEHARLIRSLPPRRFLKLLSQCALAVGNSSALIREGSYFGIPRIILGDRQRGRMWTKDPSTLYGDGYAAQRIAALCQQMVNG
jgi:UDP-hydrolysing UDP-N-acetyl-D-glucosamine 2-epimerase